MPGAAVEVGLSDWEAALQDLGVLELEHVPCIQAGVAEVRKKEDPSCLTLQRPHMECYSSTHWDEPRGGHRGGQMC